MQDIQNENKNKYKGVVICAGHWIGDPGAMANGLKERDLTIKIRDGLKYFLNLHYPGINVHVDDDSKNLSQVIKWIKELESDGNPYILYDIHLNSADSNSATGVESFVADNASARSHAMGASFNKVVSEITGLKDRGVKTESQSKRGRLGILHTKSPAIIAEMGFINNPNDVNALKEWDGWMLEDLAHDIAAQAKY